MATAGHLVFEGTGNGRFDALAADTGKILWSQAIGSSINGAPASTMIDGVQYIIVLAAIGHAQSCVASTDDNR